MKTSSSLRPLAGRLALAAASVAAILATTAPARAQRPAFDEVFAYGNGAAVGSEIAVSRFFPACATQLPGNK